MSDKFAWNIRDAHLISLSFSCPHFFYSIYKLKNKRWGREFAGNQYKKFKFMLKLSSEDKSASTSRYRYRFRKMCFELMKSRRLNQRRNWVIRVGYLSAVFDNFKHPPQQALQKQSDYWPEAFLQFRRVSIRINRMKTLKWNPTINKS